jgi:uncharacterized protein with GYD domain
MRRMVGTGAKAGGGPMAKYLFKASLSPEGVAGVLKEGGVSRRDAATRALQSLGGSLESYYFAFGATDAYAIADLPDDVAAAAFALTVGASGPTSLETVVLITPETIDAARERSVDYRAPGS